MCLSHAHAHARAHASAVPRWPHTRPFARHTRPIHAPLRMHTSKAAHFQILSPTGFEIVAQLMPPSVERARQALPKAPSYPESSTLPLPVSGCALSICDPSPGRDAVNDLSSVMPSMLICLSADHPLRPSAPVV